MGRVVTLAALLSSIATSAEAQATPAVDQQPLAIVAEYDGIIHPIAAEFFDEVIARADTSGATVTVLVLRTPGGLLDSTRSIVSRMIAARTPIVIFVAPSGGRAASAGFIIVLAGDVAVMAPGTHIGAAHPVSAGGGDSKPDETMAKKAASDAAAYARTLAESRGRNATLAAAAVLESRAFTEREALTAAPPLIDFVASDVDDLLRQLNGRTVKRFDGRSVTLNTTGIRIEQAAMTRRQHFLSAIAHPQIAYLLLTLGMLGLTVELWNPGGIAPGVLGGISILLAFFAFQILPVNTIGLLLVIFGVALLLLEIKIPSFGVLGTGGAAALVIGSVMLTNELPGVRVSYQFVVPVALAFAAILLFLGRLGLNAQRIKSVTGSEGLIGARGQTLTPLGPDEPGQVNVHGEIWRATSAAPIEPGRGVRVTALNGLTVLVEPLESELRGGESS